MKIISFYIKKVIYPSEYENSYYSIVRNRFNKNDNEMEEIDSDEEEEGEENVSKKEKLGGFIVAIVGLLPRENGNHSRAIESKITSSNKLQNIEPYFIFTAKATKSNDTYKISKILSKNIRKINIKNKMSINYFGNILKNESGLKPNYANQINALLVNKINLSKNHRKELSKNGSIDYGIVKLYLQEIIDFPLKDKLKEKFLKKIGLFLNVSSINLEHEMQSLNAKYDNLFIFNSSFSLSKLFKLTEKLEEKPEHLVVPKVAHRFIKKIKKTNEFLQWTLRLKSTLQNKTEETSKWDGTFETAALIIKIIEDQCNAAKMISMEFDSLVERIISQSMSKIFLKDKKKLDDFYDNSKKDNLSSRGIKKMKRSKLSLINVYEKIEGNKPFNDYYIISGESKRLIESAIGWLIEMEYLVVTDVKNLDKLITVGPYEQALLITRSDIYKNITSISNYFFKVASNRIMEESKYISYPKKIDEFLSKSNENGLKPNDGQKKAIKQSLLNPFFSISGEAGSGKTFCMKHILKCLNSISGKKNDKCRPQVDIMENGNEFDMTINVLILTSYGASEDNVRKKLIEDDILNTEKYENIHVRTNTIAMAKQLYKVRLEDTETDEKKEKFGSANQRFIENLDYLFIDEFQNVSFKDLSNITKFVNGKEVDGIILFGDLAQLGPIGIGNPYFEFTYGCPKFKCHRLTDNMRVDDNKYSLKSNLKIIRKCNSLSQEFDKSLIESNFGLEFVNEHHGGFEIVTTTRRMSMEKHIYKYYLDEFKICNDQNLIIDGEKMVVPNLIITTPMRVTMNLLNIKLSPVIKRLFSKYNKKWNSKKFVKQNKVNVTSRIRFKKNYIPKKIKLQTDHKKKLGDRVIVSNGVKNGETGWVKDIQSIGKYLKCKNNYILTFVNNFSEVKTVVVGGRHIDYFDLEESYCNTIHTTLGTESRVSIFIPGPITNIRWVKNREIYTALSRAKEKCVVLGTEELAKGSEIKKYLSRRYFPSKNFSYDDNEDVLVDPSLFLEICATHNDRLKCSVMRDIMNKRIF